MKRTRELTQGNILIGLWAFAVPLMLGNVMQQLYNLVDTWVVGKYIGEQALAAVGASYTLMTFLTSVILGLCLGAGAFFSMAYGKKRPGCLSKWFGHVIYRNRRAGTDRDGSCIFITELYYTMASGAQGNVCGYADLSGLRDGRLFCDIFI